MAGLVKMKLKLSSHQMSQESDLAKWDKVIVASNSNNENIVTGSAYFHFLKI